MMQYIRQFRAKFWVIAAFLVLVFFIGGGSRDDVESLLILRPAAALMCCFALFSLRMEEVRANRFAFGIAAAVAGLCILHLIPLPPALWQNLPGRQLAVQVDAAAGLQGVWRPLSLAPDDSWNALYSLLVPFAIFLMGVQLRQRELHALLPLFVALGLLSGVLGILQILGPPHGSLYLYRVTNDGAAVGMFANRNHQALLLALLFPMLATYAMLRGDKGERSIGRSLLAAGAGLVLVPLLLITGSRAGLLIGICGLLSIAMIYRLPSTRRGGRSKALWRDWRYWAAAAVVSAMVAIAALSSKAEALSRLLAAGQGNDRRFQMWGPIAEMAWKYFPFGSGVGSFVEVYQVDEPRNLLSLTYTNHAHNDFLEIWLTAGVPGVILLLLAVVLLGRRIWSRFRAPVRAEGDLFGRLGAFLVVFVALASLGDYPLRVPSISCLFVVAVLWVSGERRAVKDGKGLIDDEVGGK
ncbi:MULTISPECIES: O-antigen ligase family protein [Sphingomonas]|uniref:O-antigen ligase n=1 Tax=Sphingomonas kyeonggiensis TaxID=1268553 RepID=A0A7W7NTI7_9SPHN|nr:MULTISPECIES: O-antigen ligase family protein [Sphingomonas]MBB4839794.1 O-antigen ligase [Sphingomonas kyeonggiensis]WHU02997.1 O-antigen ligase family protein [Sphingomonas sp. NIBR02145]